MDDFTQDDMEESTSYGKDNLKKKIAMFEKIDPEYAALLKKISGQTEEEDSADEGSTT